MVIIFCAIIFFLNALSQERDVNAIVDSFFLFQPELLPILMLQDSYVTLGMNVM